MLGGLIHQRFYPELWHARNELHRARQERGIALATVSLRDEATELLQELIRLDTVNPPGNETLAAELLRDYLQENGVEVELYAKVPKRANLVARIPGRGDGPRLAFLSHTDTVLADPGEWTARPVVGRGSRTARSGAAARST